MKALAKAISSGSLRGARGNSGVILSQLFRGFTKVIAEYDEINVQILSDAFQKAVETAYKAVMKPKEGTILTVAKGMSDRALELCDEYRTIWYIFVKRSSRKVTVCLDHDTGDAAGFKTGRCCGFRRTGTDAGHEGCNGRTARQRDRLLPLRALKQSKRQPESTGTSYNIEAQANQEIKFAYCTQFLDHA